MIADSIFLMYVAIASAAFVIKGRSYVAAAARLAMTGAGPTRALAWVILTRRAMGDALTWPFGLAIALVNRSGLQRSDRVLSELKLPPPEVVTEQRDRVVRFLAERAYEEFKEVHSLSVAYACLALAWDQVSQEFAQQGLEREDAHNYFIMAADHTRKVFDADRE